MLSLLLLPFSLISIICYSIIISVVLLILESGKGSTQADAGRDEVPQTKESPPSFFTRGFSVAQILTTQVGRRAAEKGSRVADNTSQAFKQRHSMFEPAPKSQSRSSLNITVMNCMKEISKYNVCLHLMITVMCMLRFMVILVMYLLLVSKLLSFSSQV